MPNDTLNPNADTSSEQKNEATTATINETPSSEKKETSDSPISPTADSKKASNATAKSSFFHATKRKQMTQTTANENELQVSTQKKGNWNPSYGSDVQLPPPQLPAFMTTLAPPSVPCSKNLEHDFYQPFLVELFRQIANKKADELDFSSTKEFILTGSAAKQLQDSTLRNPNDIDLLVTNESLEAAVKYIKEVFGQINGLSITYEDLCGTFHLSYNNTTFKLQVIDQYTSKECFPDKFNQKSYFMQNEIQMLKTSEIPVKAVIKLEKPVITDFQFDSDEEDIEFLGSVSINPGFI